MLYASGQEICMFFCETRGHLYSKFNNVALPKMSSELEPEVE